jgi:hypothetical protein
VKIVLYDDYKVGLLKDGNVVDVSGVAQGWDAAADHRGTYHQLSVAEGGSTGNDQGGIPLQCAAAAPVPRPGKIVCMGELRGVRWA